MKYTFFRKRVLPLSWEYATQGQLWRLIPSSDGYFVGEDRQTDSKQVSFFCINQITGKVLWDKLCFNEQWWISIETTYRDVIFLHEFSTPDLPEHKKIYAIHRDNGKLLWMNDVMTYRFAFDNKVIASKDSFDQRLFFEFDLYSGEIVGEADSSNMTKIQGAQLPNVDEIVEFPKVFESSNDDNVYVVQCIDKALKKAGRIDNIEYLEKGNSLVVGYSKMLNGVSSEPSLQQDIMIMNKNTSRITYQDTISAQSKVSVPETFFRIGDIVYYVKDKRRLRAVNILDESHR
ncbi:MAG TPA: DUF4905 domain-containing protein [Bacteroidota bacterium]|nr:DUF4905 domain-containing protein [Bacteroidota bacterium]